MSKLQVYNTATRTKEEFQTLEPGKVKMYVCGPTVYGLLHVGNFRGAVFFNLVRRWLIRAGYQVEFAYNYTDVDDKIIDRAKRENRPPEDVAEQYIAEFKKDFAALKLDPHSHNPRVTESMDSIREIVSKLVASGTAYVSDDGEVLYSVRKFNGYGKLSHRNLDDLQAGARVEVDRKKQDPMDFALWKPAKPGEPKWPSPWCEGRPGWHIECSAMVKSLFGDTIDIHGGGSDLIFPHHENEVAQSEGATGQPYAKYWLHNNMITFGDRKMSKSLGNIMTAREFLEKYDAEIMKYMLLSVHYRSLSDFSEQAIGFAVHGLARVYSALNLSVKWSAAWVASSAAAPVSAGNVRVPLAFQTALDQAERDLVEALNDDFNTPEMFAAIFSLVRAFNSINKTGLKVTAELAASAEKFREWVLNAGQLLSLFQEEPSAYLMKLDDRLLGEKGQSRESIEALVAERSAARAEKNFKRSDELRDQLVAMGIVIQDSPQGTTWEVAK